MKINMNKLRRYTIIFLLIMLFCTIVSNKVDYMMTPEVQASAKEKTQLRYEINTAGNISDGYVVFDLNMEKESYIQTGDKIQTELVNIKGSISTVVEEKNFNADYQTMRYRCAMTQQRDDVYEGQNCQIKFNYIIGEYDYVFPRECVIYEGAAAYVYRIETIKTVLGEKQIVRKQEITVGAEDDFRVALSGGIGERDMLVKNSVKPLRNEQKVRVVQ